MASVTSDNIKTFPNELTAMNCTKGVQSAADATKNRYRASLSGFCIWLVQNQILRVHPIAAKAVRVKKEAAARLPRMSVEQTQLYLDTANMCGAAEALFLTLLLSTGCDVGKLLRARVEDIYWEPAPRIRYQRTKTLAQTTRYTDIVGDVGRDSRAVRAMESAIVGPRDGH